MQEVQGSSVCVSRYLAHSTVRRHCPAFCSLQYRKAGEGLVNFIPWVMSR